MKHVMLVAAAALLFTAALPDQADARRGARAGGFVRGPVAVRGPVIVRRGPGYYRRGYYGPGLGAAVGLGVLGAAAVGAATYGYADPCLRQQEVYDAYGNIRLATVRVC